MIFCVAECGFFLLLSVEIYFNDGFGEFVSLGFLKDAKHFINVWMFCVIYFGGWK